MAKQKKDKPTKFKKINREKIMLKEASDLLLGGLKFFQDKIAPYISPVIFVVIGVLVIFVALQVTTPLNIKDVPKQVEVLSYGEDWNIMGWIFLSNTASGVPVHYFFIAGDNIFARDINIFIDGKPKFLRANLRMYGLPEEEAQKNCGDINDEEKKFEGVILSNVFEGQRLSYTSPITDELLSKNRLSTNKIRKSGSWKILLCLEIVKKDSEKEDSSMINISEATVNVITNYDYAILQYQTREGFQSYFAIIIAVLALLFTFRVEGNKGNLKTKDN